MQKFISFFTLMLISIISFNQTALNFTQNAFGSYKETVTVPGIDIDGNPTVSAEAWCLIDNYFEPASPVIIKETVTTACGYQNLAFIIFIDNSDNNNLGLVRFGIGDGTDFHSALSNIPLPLGEWHHLAGTYDGTTLRLYIDGIERGSDNVTQLIHDAGIEMNIGNKWNCARRSFDGDIDEVRVWNDVRTVQEIRENMYRELINPTGETDLIAYYRFNEGSGTIAYDSGPNAYDGQLGGYSFGGNTTTAPTWVTSTAPIPYYTITNGNWDSDNTWDYGQMAPVNDWSRVIINHDVHLNQDQTLMDLVINSGSIFTVDESFDLTMDGDIQNNAGNAGFIIAADATGMGSLIHTTSDVPATVEQYLSSEQWHMISSPVSNAEIGIYTDIYLMEYEESNDSWSDLIQPTTLPLNVAQGYSAWASDGYTGTTTVNFAGLLNTGDYTLSSFSYTPASPTTGWNLIGNPYPSALQWNNSWTKTDIGDWACVHNNGNDECYDPATGTSWPNPGDMANGIIPSTQGFWVRATSASASLTFPQSERQHSSQAFYKDSNVEIDNAIRLRVDGNDNFDVVLVQFTPDATYGFDAKLDLEKRWGNENSPQIYSPGDDGPYSVNVLPEVHDDLIIPIGFEVGVPGIYALSVTEMFGFTENTPVFIEDIKENTLTELALNSIYEFAAGILDDPHRFNLLFKAGSFGINDNITEGVYVYSNDNNIYIKTQSDFKGDVVVYDMLGQVVTSTKTNGESLMNLEISNGTGFYFVKVQADSQTMTKKVFIR